jgi:signal transduction histidine kinase
MGTLSEQWHRLRELDKFRRESVSNLSHDLRSPLTAATASLETLKQRWSHQPARESDMALLDVALRNTQSAARLVRSLLDLSLLDEPEFRLQPMRVDLTEMLDDIALRFAARATGQRVRLSHQLSAEEGQAADMAPAEVDIELFERAMANLVDNALKHTPAGGRVVLQTRVEAERLSITVSDTGCGIDPAELPHLFDRLYQGAGPAAPAASERGKGLGLAIVKRIVELHGGSVSLSSQPGHGTQVQVLLPRGTPSQDPSAAVST